MYSQRRSTGARRQITSKHEGHRGRAPRRGRSGSAACRGGERGAPLPAPALTGSRTSARSRLRAAHRPQPANENRTAPEGPDPGEPQDRRQPSARPPRARRRSRSRRSPCPPDDVVCPEDARYALAPAPQAGPVPDRDRPDLPVVAVQERLRKGARDDLERLGVARPVPIVPPGHVAVAQSVRGGGPVSGEAVDEPEPVFVPTGAALDAVDRLDEAAAVPGRHLRLRPERAQQCLPGRERWCRGATAAAVACHPEVRRAVRGRRPLPAAARKRDRDEEEQRRNAGGSLHGVRSHRADGVRANRPRCAPTHTRPFAPASKRRPSTRSWAPPAAAALPASSNDLTA